MSAVLEKIFPPAAREDDPAPGPKPHVCFVAPQCWPILSRDPSTPVVGGAEVQQCIIARGLAKAGYRVSMITLDYGQPEYVVVDGIAVHKAHRPDEGLPVVRALHPRMTAWWRAMKAVDADIYYQRSSAVLTAVVAEFTKRHGRASVYAGASDVDFRPGEEMIDREHDRWLFRRGLRMADRIVVQNLAQQRDCLQAYHRHAIYIPSGYAPPGDARFGATGDAVVWVANVREAKRPMRFLDIAERLPHRRFVLVGGGGDHFAAVKARAAAMPNVELPGFLPVHAAEAWFDQARVVVNTSNFEGMPNTFLQAWARGVPTRAFIDVGARFGGEPLYPVSTTIEEAAASIERLYTDLAWRDRESQRSRQYFEAKHSVRHVIGCYARLFATLPAGRAA